MKRERSQIRQEIMDIIHISDVPLSANDVHDKMSISSDLASVYRNLNYLEAKSKIQGYLFACCHERMKKFYYSLGKPHVHFFHCDKCHRFLPFHDCEPWVRAKETEKKYSFKVKSHSLSLSGLCNECLTK